MIFLCKECKRPAKWCDLYSLHGEYFYEWWCGEHAPPEREPNSGYFPRQLENEDYWKFYDQAITSARREERAAAIEAAARVADDMLAAMPERTIFPVTKGLLMRVAASIRALLPPETK